MSVCLHNATVFNVCLFVFTFLVKTMIRNNINFDAGFFFLKHYYNYFIIIVMVKC